MKRKPIFSSLVLLELIQGLSCQTFLVSPAHAVAKLGETARFNCTVKPSVVSSDNLEWHLRGGPNSVNIRIFSTVYPDSTEVGYTVERDQSSGRYDLIVTSVALSNVGSFECELGRTQQKQVANLILVNIITCPIEPNMKEIPAAGEDAWLLCKVQSAGSVGPFMNWMSTVSGSISIQSDTSQHVGDYTEYTRIGNITTSSDLDGSTARCEISFQGIPSYQERCENILLVKHGVDKVVIMPMLDGDEVLVGTTLNCSANGRPLPTVYWRNIDDGTYVYESQLQVTMEMVGTTQRWQCIATNEIRGTTFTRDANVTFQVVVGGTERQNVTLESAQITEPNLHVEWTYRATRNSRYLSSVMDAKVSVLIEYRVYNTEYNFVRYPPHCNKIPAENQTAIVPGAFSRNIQYEVRLVVYEGELESALTAGKITETQTASSASAIAAGILGGMVVILLIVLDKRDL